MPCTDPYDYRPDYNTVQQNLALKSRNDQLTHENDMLREILLKILYAEPHSDVKFVGVEADLIEEIKAKHGEKIKKAQIEHRKHDLKRLEKTFKKMIAEGFGTYYEYLGRVAAADPNKPLAEQLGFDPDAY